MLEGPDRSFARLRPESAFRLALLKGQKAQESGLRLKVYDRAARAT